MTTRLTAAQYKKGQIPPPAAKECAMVRLEINDMPPSTNGLRKSFIKDGKVMSVKSAEYDAWRKAAIQEIAAQRAGRVSGPYTLSIAAQRNWRSKRARDIDNIIKPISDALVKAGIVDDDSLAECVSARWADYLNGPAVVVIVQTAEQGIAA